MTEGTGEAEFESTDVQSGRVSLRITPPQRSSPRIAGWKFPIREKPGPGEYRYLRFAWKTDGGDGVMLELADDGRWPPADRPLRRYYSGKNTTGWKATQVSARALLVDRGNSGPVGRLRRLHTDRHRATAIGGPALFDRVELLQEAP